MNFRVWIFLVMTLFLVLTPVLESKDKSSKKATKSKKTENKGKRKAGKNRKKIQAFRKENPELWADFVTQRKSWSKLKGKQKGEARKAYFAKHPQLANALKSGRPKGPMAKLKEKFPKDHEAFRAAQEKWKGLKGKELFHAREDFFKTRAEFRYELEKTRKQLKARRKKRNQEKQKKTK